jgi:RHS repeat-associated protein
MFRVSDLSYDPNGNLRSLRRYHDTGIRNHDLAYDYAPNKNRLTSVSGHVNAYSYDKIGQMTGEDKVEGDDQYVEYDATGKVRKVFSDAQKQSLKVEFIYDDRGFRLAKKDMETNVTTWYIRDASGNVLSIFEEESGNLNQTEVPIYGAGKLGTYYPQQEGAAVYELSDHLGNVRALVRDNVTEYMATLEDNGQASLANPRVSEMQYFQNLFETGQTDVHMNHTLPVPGVEETPDKSSYLFWQSGVAGMDASSRSIGPGIVLKVNAGDKIDMESWVRYERKTSYARNIDILLLSQLLGASFGGTGALEGVPQATNAFQDALQLAGFAEDGDDDARPFAYLNYIIFSADLIMIDAGWQRVPEDAGFYPGEEAIAGMHRKVSFETPVAVPQNGYIYVWVSNEGENTKVWFDDLKVTHSGSFVTQATDYGVWGDVLREQKTEETTYRFGYQGEYAERDEETGWNHFELREYDPVIGRWTATDPAGQFWSPYNGMGNNPVNGVDPDGSTWYWNPGTNEFRWLTGWAAFKAWASPYWVKTPDNGTTINLGNGWIPMAAPAEFVDPSSKPTRTLGCWFPGYEQFSLSITLLSSIKSKGVVFWGSGDFGTNEMGQGDPSGKEVININVDDLGLLGTGRDFKRLGGSRYNPYQRNNQNPPPGQQEFENFGEIDKTANAIYEHVDYMNKMRHRRAQLIQHIMDSIYKNKLPYAQVIYEKILRDTVGIRVIGPNNTYMEYDLRKLNP